MNKSSICPAYKFMIRDALISVAIFYSVMIIVTGAFILGAININMNIDGNSYSAFSGFGIAAVIFMFISGIVSIREELRMFMQNGIGRRTTFIVQILYAGTASAVLAVMVEILLQISKLIVRADSSIIISDTYYLLFEEYNLLRNTFVLHLESIVTYTVMFVCAYTAGVFVSLVFYRLNKIWTVVVAVGVPVFTFIGLPILIKRLNISLSRPIELVFYNPWTYIAFFVVISVLVSFFNWLLVRRVPVKPAAI